MDCKREIVVREYKLVQNEIVFNSYISKGMQSRGIQFIYLNTWKSIQGGTEYMCTTQMIQFVWKLGYCMGAQSEANGFLRGALSECLI